MKTPIRKPKPATGEPHTPPKLDAKEFETVILPLAKIRRYHNNPRENEKGVQKLVASLVEFGFRKPLVLDHQHEIIAGDTTFVAAGIAGFPAVPCWIVPAGRLTAEQIRAYRLADNRTAEESDWHAGKLGVELTELLEADFDLGMTGFDRKELERYLSDDDESGLDPIEIRPAPRYAWVLIGIDVARYHEVSEEVEKISKVPDIFCEIAANSNDPTAPVT